MKILLPVDGSQGALDAVRHAINLTEQGLQASFVVANVQEPTHLYELLMTTDPQTQEQASQAAAVDALASAQNLLKRAKLSFECEIATGEAGNTLLAIIERFGCEAVIMGSHGVGSLHDALLGSVSQTVLNGSPVPVTVVRPATN